MHEALQHADAFDTTSIEHEPIMRAGLGLLRKFPWERPVRLVGLRVSNFVTDEQQSQPSDASLF